jgi:hypothetical protein
MNQNFKLRSLNTAFPSQRFESAYWVSDYKGYVDVIEYSTALLLFSSHESGSMCNFYCFMENYLL